MTQLYVDKLADKAGTGPTELEFQSAAKAWLHYVQQSATIENSYNVSSVSDDSEGIYTLSFTNSFDAADNYVTAGTTNFSDFSGGTGTIGWNAMNAGNCGLNTRDGSDTNKDGASTTTFHGTLA